MEKNHFVSVAGLIVNDKNEILLIKSPLPWRGFEFPGGMVERGETLQQALKREIFEESGVDVEITAFVGICKNVERDIVNIDFCCKYKSGELTTSDESREVKWVSKDEALRLVSNPLTKKRLENMLCGQGKMHCFSFKKNPFVIIDDDDFNIGL